MKNAQRILATALLIPVLTYTTRADIITQWTFETSLPATAGPFAPETGGSLGAATGSHAGASVYSTPAGNGSAHSFSSNTWAVGDYYQFTTNLTGFQDIVLKWDQTSSGTGPRDFDLQYTIDGTNYLVVPGFDNYLVNANAAPNPTWNGTTASPLYSYTADLTSITALNNFAGATFRLKVDSTVSANGGVLAAGGTDRVDNFTVNGVTFFNSVNNYWDTNGPTAGLGGNGTWTGSSSTWSLQSDGTGPTQSLDPAGKAIFAGTGGTVTVGVGAVANGGIIFDSTGYTLATGSLEIKATGPRIQVTNAADTATISATLTGSAGLNKTGAGTLVVSGTNTYTGTTTISAGVLQIAANAGLGDSANAVALAGGTLKTTASVVLPGTRNFSGAGTLDIAPGTTLTVNGKTTAGLITLANVGSLILSGSTSAPSVAGLTFAQAATVTVSGAALDMGSITTTHTVGTSIMAATGGTIDFGTAGRTLNVARGNLAVDLRFTADVSNSSATALVTKVGAGILEFAGSSNSFAGIFQLGQSGSSTPASATQGGTVIIHDIGSLGNGGAFRFNSGEVNNASGGILTFPTIGISLAAGQLPGGATFSGSPFNFQSASSLFKAGTTAYQHLITANTDVTFEGGFAVSTGTGTSTGLTITGTGRVFFPTSSALTENITVDGGKFYVTSVFSAVTKPTITAINGGILGGDQSSGLGAVIAQAGGIIAPGTPDTAISTLNTANASVLAGGSLQLQIGGKTSGTFDQLNVTGTVTLGGGLNVSLSSFTPTPGDQFVIILNDGADQVSGTFTNLAENSTFSTADYAYRINYNVNNATIGADGNDVVLTAIPEPASAALLLGGLALITARRRRK